MEPYEFDARRDGGDGRVARGRRTRSAILDAFEGLIGDGEIPTSGGLAKRAGISSRSIFVHFEDLDAICVAATERLLSHLERGRRAIDPASGYDERLALFCSERAHTLELLRPLLALPPTHRQSSEPNRRAFAEVHAALRAETCRVFAAELDRGTPIDRFRRTEATVAVTAWPHWHGLRSGQALTAAEAESVMAHGLDALLAGR